VLSGARAKWREYRVEGAESARAQSREEGAECTMRAQCESAKARVKGRECRESARVQSREYRVENAESRVQRTQGHIVERREHSAR